MLAAELPGEVDEGAGAFGRGVAASDHRRFVGEHRTRRAPSRVDVADNVLGRHPHVGEEHLVEVARRR